MLLFVVKGVVRGRSGVWTKLSGLCACADSASLTKQQLCCAAMSNGLASLTSALGTVMFDAL